MVELEEPGQLVGVVLGALGVVEHLQLAVHDRLAAVGDVEEHRVGARAGAGLLGRRRDGGALCGVDRRRDLADLVRAVVDDRELGVDVDGLAPADPVEQRGQHGRRPLGPRLERRDPAPEPVARPHGDQHRGHHERDDGQHEADDHVQRGVRPGDGAGDGVVGRAERQVRGLGRDLVARGRQVADERVTVGDGPVRGHPVAAARRVDRGAGRARPRREQPVGVRGERAPLRRVEQGRARVPPRRGQGGHRGPQRPRDRPGLGVERPVGGHVQAARTGRGRDRARGADRLRDRQQVARRTQVRDDVPADVPVPSGSPPGALPTPSTPASGSTTGV